MARERNEPPVFDNRDEARYETTIDGQLSVMDYDLNGDTIAFTHTEVPNALRNRGIASRMARFALDDARARDLTVVPLCPFVAGYIHRHPEYHSLVDWPPAESSIESGH